MKPKVRNIVLWVLTTLFILAVIIGILCWTGAIPSTILTAPIRKVTNGLMGVLLLATKIFPRIRTFVEETLKNAARKHLLNPLFYFGVCLWAWLRLKPTPDYYPAYNKFYDNYIDPHILRFKTWFKSKWGKSNPVVEWLLNLCGYKICPETHNDPTIHGPQLRVLTKNK